MSSFLNGSAIVRGMVKTLKPGPRALYAELKRRYNGSNNGRIFLSHRDAANALHVTATRLTLGSMNWNNAVLSG